jgi:UDP-N-acetylmuramyl pentapeptide phosphotransferase/UDP-N-acetylglucosamine-1-phosphate transferase
MLSLAIAAIAAGLGLRLLHERRRRETDLSDEDRTHFSRQDLRRGIGVAVLLVIAVGVLFGSRIAPSIAGHANLQFVWVWIAVMVLVLVLVTLALFDSLATRRYAMRHRRAMARELSEIARSAPRHNDIERNGPVPDSRPLP